MKKQKLAIISNEKTYQNKSNYYCDNVDMKSIPEGLKKNFHIELFVRKSKKIRSAHKINIKNIIISSGIFSYIYKVIKSSNLNNKYLIISLSPYTFVMSILLFILGKKVFIYLRSDGYEEYRSFSKYFGPLLYHFMFSLACLKSQLIACRSKLLKGKKGKIVSPSQLNKKWFNRRKAPQLKKIKLLYVGRLRVEKGIFSLIEIIKKLKFNFAFTIVNPEKLNSNKLKNEKIKIVQFNKNHDSLINIYDNSNIFILPSFTEAHPQVLDESLSRLRPVIIFPEISHVQRNREGVFVVKRNAQSLSNKINFILKRYKSIQKKMLKNRLPTKNLFTEQLKNIIIDA